MRVLALVESAAHVCCRYRLRAFGPGLIATGHTLELIPLGAGLQRWRNLDRTADADVVILQRKLLTRWELARLRRRTKKLIFDFDDAVFLRDSHHRKGPKSRKLSRRFRATASCADILVVGNDWLAEHARQAGARQVALIPTCVDPARYIRAKHDRRDDALTLVWLGSSSTLHGLERARPLLEHLGRSLPGLTLRLVCDRFLRFEQLKVECWPWSQQSEAEALASADVGLSYLPDDDWSRGKCGLKVLQYLAAWLPVVGNDVGVTRTLIQDAGFVANSAEEWTQALRRLHDRDVRQNFGAVGRRRVCERYSVRTGLQQWLSLLDPAVELRRAG